MIPNHFCRIISGGNAGCCNRAFSKCSCGSQKPAYAKILSILETGFEGSLFIRFPLPFWSYGSCNQKLNSSIHNMNHSFS
jgi:hypothetical protein